MSSGSKPNSERKTIGVFASQVGRAWGSEFITGITEAAEASNVNIVHFIGGNLRPVLSADNKPSFGLYDLAKPDQSSWHSTILALLLLLHVTFPAPS